MPSKSQSQRGLIFGKRSKYGSIENTPKKWKWIWEEGWENKGKLPKKKKMNENVITFSEFINEELQEGKSKGNQKYGPVICNDCGHKADGFEFKRSFRKGLRCPKCKSKSVSNAPKPKVAPAPQSRIKKED